MNASDHDLKSVPQRDEALFQAAAQLTGPQRVAFLDSACHGDPALRQRLDALLAAHELIKLGMDTKQVITMKPCAYCGRENSEQANYCCECGTPFEAPPTGMPPRAAESPQAPSQPGKSPVFGVMSMSLLVVGFVGGLRFASFYDDKSRRGSRPVPRPGEAFRRPLNMPSRKQCRLTHTVEDLKHIQ